MERVVTINLNGNSYQLEEPAYDALRAYINRAEATLSGNPDKAEIVRDLEQAIADKCATYLSGSKNVVTGGEMAKILGEMGPVEGADEAGAAGGASTSSEAPRKRLYRITADAKIAGVCSGIGAFFDIDPNIVRLLFIVGALLTSGALVLLYIALMFLIPSAQTSEEWAAAHGVPFNAQDVIDRAKREYSNFTGESQRSWREQRRAWRQAMRDRRNAWRYQPADAPAKPAGYATRTIAGLLALVLSIITAALLIGFLIALYSLLTTGAVLGWTPPYGPDWFAVVVLCIVYGAVATPLAHLRRSSYATASGYRYARGSGDDMAVLLAMLVAGVIAYQFVPDFRWWVDALPHSLPMIRINAN